MENVGGIDRSGGSMELNGEKTGQVQSSIEGERDDTVFINFHKSMLKRALRKTITLPTMRSGSNGLGTWKESSIRLKYYCMKVVGSHVLFRSGCEKL
jgi:hypothetical protein